MSSSVVGSQKRLAKLLNIPQNTFQGYLKIERQDNLWPLLPLILKVVPQVSREWLYFGEGDMLIAKRTDQQSMPPEWGNSDALHMLENIQQKLDTLEQELAEERRLNRQLTTRLLVDGVGDKGDAKNIIGKAADGQ